MQDLPFHVRALDSDGNSIRQLLTSFATVEEAEAAAKRADRMYGDEHVVCVSLDPKDRRNIARSKNPLKIGWIKYDPNDEEEVDEDAKARNELAQMKAEAKRAKAEADIMLADAKAALEEAKALKAEAEKANKPEAAAPKKSAAKKTAAKAKK